MNQQLTSLFQPFFIATAVSAMFGIGYGLMNKDVVGSRRKEKRNTSRAMQIIWPSHKEEIIYSSSVGLATGLLVSLWTKSFILATPFIILSATLTWSIVRARAKRTELALANIWPEVIDHLISGIYSGLSLSETLVGLSTRGPEGLRSIFSQFHRELLQTGDFSIAVGRLKSTFNSHSSDQILEALLLAKALGGSELLQIFRTLGDFLREDLALRKEIAIKHGWIKNSAHLSAAAPWILLFLLSSQPGTVDSFSSPGGIVVLGLAMFMTMIAYLWMGRLSRLPKVPRIFSESR